MNQDFVLCPVDELIRYVSFNSILSKNNSSFVQKTILKELNAERNMIRGQSEQVLSEYREKKERELKELTTELENSNMTMMEKMRVGQEFEES